MVICESSYAPTRGALTFDEVFTLPRIWFDCHECAEQWLASPSNPRQIHDRKMVDDAQRDATKHLAKTPASRWFYLCTAAGMTVYGAVALSWCEGAELSQVWEGWEASGFPLKPLPEYERPARFINPALLPTTNSLLELVKLAENKPLPICAMIVAKGDALDVDLSVNMAANASPQIAALRSMVSRRFLSAVSPLAVLATPLIVAVPFLADQAMLNLDSSCQ